MRVLLVSSYENGHQPLHVASPAAALRAAGHDVRAVDLSVERWDPALVDWAERVAFSVPMHTAMRLALHAAAAVRSQRPELPICLYGLYAPVSRDLTVGRLADRVIAGEYEPALVAWCGGDDADSGLIQLGRGTFEPPARDLLPPLESYAHLRLGGEERLVGYVEASHGCVHMCRHCPLPTVYDGRIRIVGADTVIADVEQLVEMGARHITFGDPDFLNGVKHSRDVVRAMHERWPWLTWDATVKVEHVLEHAHVWPEFARSGCLFVISAVECLSDEILRKLDKGHTAEQASAAVALLREHGIETRPSLMPFTPWTSVDDLREVFDWVVANDLIGNVDPVQYTIRLLVPEGSLITTEMGEHLGEYDAGSLSYRWESPLDVLQRRMAAIAEGGADEPPANVFYRLRAEVFCDDDEPQIEPGSVEGRPRMTEPWFC